MERTWRSLLALNVFRASNIEKRKQEKKHNQIMKLLVNTAQIEEYDMQKWNHIFLAS